jgi:hypothetical protein
LPELSHSLLLKFNQGAQIAAAGAGYEYYVLDGTSDGETRFMMRLSWITQNLEAYPPQSQSITLTQRVGERPVQFNIPLYGFRKCFRG